MRALFYCELKDTKKAFSNVVKRVTMFWHKKFWKELS